MQVLIRSGFSNEMLLRLNQVRVCQQLLFMSDILTASGNKINPEVLSPQPPGEAWSNMTWPNEHPTDSEKGHSFHLPKSKHLNACQMIHRTNPQDLAMDMEWRRFNPASPQGRRRHGGCLCFGEEAEQISPLTQPTQQPSQYNLLG